MARRIKPRIVQDIPADSPADENPDAEPEETAEPEPEPEPDPEPEPPATASSRPAEPPSEPAEVSDGPQTPRPRFVPGKGWEAPPGETAAEPEPEGPRPPPRKPRREPRKSKTGTRESRAEKLDRWRATKATAARTARDLAPALEGIIATGLVVAGRLVTGKPDPGLPAIPVDTSRYDLDGGREAVTMPAALALATVCAELTSVVGIDFLNHPVLPPLFAAAGLGSALGTALLLGSDVYGRVYAEQHGKPDAGAKPAGNLAITVAPAPPANDNATETQDNGNVA